MKTGFAKIDITPPLGSNLNGYYRERYSDHIIEPLYVSAVAYSDGEHTAITISLDISEILQRDTNDIRAKVAAYTGVPFEAVFLASIHTHTAPVISEIPGFFKRDENYYKEFCDNVCRCAAEAIDDMKDSVVSIARGTVEGITFIRRYRTKDGIPGEPFTEIGRTIKENSPFAMTIVCCNANGSEGYFPTDDALKGTGYESASSLFLPGVAPEMIQTSLETLKELKTRTK